MKEGEDGVRSQMVVPGSRDPKQDAGGQDDDGGAITVAQSLRVPCRSTTARNPTTTASPPLRPQIRNRPSQGWPVRQAWASHQPMLRGLRLRLP